MKISKSYYPKNCSEWRDWLIKNHSEENEIWVIYYKKHTNMPRVSYDDAVEQALCFGWIDSTVKKIDDEKYCQRFTPRNDKSQWSDLNKKRVAKLIKSGLMTETGLKKIEAAKNNGMWDKKRVSDKTIEMPIEFTNELKKSKKANEFYTELSPSHKKRYLAWIALAKKKETRIRRAKKAISMLANNQKLGMV